jgi:hypothetical protein
MKYLTKTDWIAISVFFLVITLIALWAIDVSVSALLSNGYLTNGFIINDPAKIYHIGLYLIILVQFANFLVFLNIVSTNYRKNPDDK